MIVKITAVVARAVQAAVHEGLKQAGLRNVHTAAARSTIFDEGRRIVGLVSPEMPLSEEPVEVVTFFVDPESESAALSLVAHLARLQTPGLGSVYSESYGVTRANCLCQANKGLQATGEGAPMFDNLTRITCIVQRGQAERIVRVALGAGAVPTITYGVGTGLRDKLGLLRITIPAEKEIVTVVTGSYDEGTLMEEMIKAGRLDQPGRGFIYAAPVRRGLINTRVARGGSAQAASTEQIISAIDRLQGNMDWRRTGLDAAGGYRRDYFGGVDLSLVCDEGRSDDVVQAALRGGAAGATVEKTRVLCAMADGGDKVSPARVTCSMVVSEDRLSQIVEAMDRAGAFGPQAHGMVVDNPIAKAFTYIPGK